jgi:hypothetical protein
VLIRPGPQRLTPGKDRWAVGASAYRAPYPVATTAAGSSSRAHPPTFVAARSALTGEHLAAYVGT